MSDPCSIALAGYNDNYGTEYLSNITIAETNFNTIITKLQNGVDVFERTNATIIPYNSTQTDRDSDLLKYNTGVSNYTQAKSGSAYIDKYFLAKIESLYKTIQTSKFLFNVKKIVFINYTNPTATIKINKIRIFESGNPPTTVTLSINNITKAAIKVGIMTSVLDTSATASTAANYISNDPTTIPNDSIEITLPDKTNPSPGDYKLCKLILSNNNTTPATRLLGVNVITLTADNKVIGDNIIDSTFTNTTVFLNDNISKYNVTLEQYLKLIKGSLQVGGVSQLRYIKDIIIYKINPDVNTPLSIKIVILDSSKKEIHTSCILAASMYPKPPDISTVPDTNLADNAYSDIAPAPTTDSKYMNCFFHFIVTDINDIDEIKITTTANTTVLNNIKIALLENDKNTLYNDYLTNTTDPNVGKLSNIKNNITNKQVLNIVQVYTLNQVTEKVGTDYKNRNIEFNTLSCIKDRTCTNSNKLMAGFNYRINNNALCKLLDNRGDCLTGTSDSICTYIKNSCNKTNMCYYLNGAITPSSLLDGEKYNPEIESCKPRQTYPRCSIVRITGIVGPNYIDPDGSNLDNTTLSIKKINYFTHDDTSTSKSFVHNISHYPYFPDRGNDYQLFDNSGNNTITAVKIGHNLQIDPNIDGPFNIIGKNKPILQFSLDWNQEVELYKLEIKFNELISTDYHIKVEVITKSDTISYKNEYWKLNGNSNSTIYTDESLTIYPYQMNIEEKYEPLTVQSNYVKYYHNNWTTQDATTREHLPKPGVYYTFYDFSARWYNPCTRSCVDVDNHLVGGDERITTDYKKNICNSNLGMQSQARSNVSMLFNGCYCRPGYYRNPTNHESCLPCDVNSTDSACLLPGDPSTCISPSQTSIPTDFSQKLNNGCYCARGWYRNGDNRGCTQCTSNSTQEACLVPSNPGQCRRDLGQTTLPTHWTQKLNNGCYCEKGYEKNSDGTSCNLCSYYSLEETCTMYNDIASCDSASGQTNNPTSWRQKLNNGCYCARNWARSSENTCLPCSNESAKQDEACQLVHDPGVICNTSSGQTRLPTGLDQRLDNGCYCDDEWYKINGTTCGNCRDSVNVSRCTKKAGDARCLNNLGQTNDVNLARYRPLELTLENGCYCIDGSAGDPHAYFKTGTNTCTHCADITFIDIGNGKRCTNGTWCNNAPNLAAYKANASPLVSNGCYCKPGYYKHFNNSLTVAEIFHQCSSCANDPYTHPWPIPENMIREPIQECRDNKPTAEACRLGLIYPGRPDYNGTTDPNKYDGIQFFDQIMLGNGCYCAQGYYPDINDMRSCKKCSDANWWVNWSKNPGLATQIPTLAFDQCSRSYQQYLNSKDDMFYTSYEAIAFKGDPLPIDGVLRPF